MIFYTVFSELKLDSFLRSFKITQRSLDRMIKDRMIKRPD